LSHRLLYTKNLGMISTLRYREDGYLSERIKKGSTDRRGPFLA